MSLGTQTQPYGKLLDYEQFIDHQLARTRARIKMTDLATAAFILLIGFVGTLLLEIVLDHAFGLPLAVRRGVLVVGLTTAFSYTLLRLVLPLVLRINAVYAAKTIEGVDATFKNSLVNYLTLRSHRDRLPKAVLATLEARAVSDLAHVEVDQAVNQQYLMKTIYAFCGVAVVFILYAAIQPKSILDSTKRAFLADVVRPTNTRLADIKPGNDEVVAGKQVVFSVDTTSGIRPEAVKLHFSVDGGKFYAIKDFEPGPNYYDPWQLTFNNVQQTMDYFVTGGDAESLHYTLTVLPAPMVTSVKIDYDFPSYTQVPPRRDIDGGSVEAIEDTTVTVHATTNEPSRGGTLNLTMGDPAPMTVAADDPYKLTGQFKVSKSGTYTISFRTTGGQLNPNPVVYDILAIADRPPQAKFLRPDRPAIKVPVNVKVDLTMSGWDDHAVKDATLHVNQENESLVSKNVLEGRSPAPEFRATEVLDLAQLHVKPGQTLRYWLTVRDNHEPAAHSVPTAAQTIEVGEPAKPEEKKQIEQQQAKDRQPFEQPPPPETDQAKEQVPPPDESDAAQGQNDTTERQPGDKGAQQGGAGTQRQTPDQGGRGSQQPNGGADPGTANPNEGGQPGSENPAGAPPPSADPNYNKMKDALQKRGLLNQNQNKGNTPPSPQPQAGGAGNPPQQGNPGAGPQNAGGNPGRSGSSGTSQNSRGNPMQNPAGPAGSREASQPRPSGTQNTDSSGNPVQSGEKGSDQPRADATGTSGLNQGSPNPTSGTPGGSNQAAPGSNPAANDSVAPGQRDATGQGTRPENAPQSRQAPNPSAHAADGQKQPRHRRLRGAGLEPAAHRRLLATGHRRPAESAKPGDDPDEQRHHEGDDRDRQGQRGGHPAQGRAGVWLA